MSTDIQITIKVPHETSIAPLHLSLISTLVAAIVAGVIPGAQASGYRFGSQSLPCQAVADATGAEAADASTIFYNPAGMTRLDGLQRNAGITVVAPHSTNAHSGSARFTGELTGGGNARDFAPNDVARPRFI